MSDAEETTALWRGATTAPTQLGPPWGTPLEDFWGTSLHPMLGNADPWLNTSNGQHRPRYLARPDAPELTFSFDMEGINSVLPDDFEEQERLARDWQPDLSGPNVSHRKPTSELVERYANSNPTYAAKTQALQETHPEFRSVIGDGNCGWRGREQSPAIIVKTKCSLIQAVFFSYCENLLLLGELSLVHDEHARLERFADSIALVGDASLTLYEDMRDELMELFNQMSTWNGSGDAIDQLETFFNNGRMLETIYCLRLLTSAQMRSDRDSYEAFMETSLESYCEQVIQGPDKELEEQGLKALSDLLLVPAGIGLEVANLHLNPGTEADIITYNTPLRPPQGGPSHNSFAPVVRLLHTPGHYDLIYRSFQADITVNSVIDVPDFHHLAIELQGLDISSPAMPWGLPADDPLQQYMPRSFAGSTTAQPLGDTNQIIFSSPQSLVDSEPSTFSQSPMPRADVHIQSHPAAVQSLSSSRLQPLSPHFEVPQPYASRPLFVHDDGMYMPMFDPWLPRGLTPVHTHHAQATSESLSSTTTNQSTPEREVLSKAHRDGPLNRAHPRNLEFDPMAEGKTPKDIEDEMAKTAAKRATAVARRTKKGKVVKERKGSARRKP